MALPVLLLGHISTLYRTNGLLSFTLQLDQDVKQLLEIIRNAQARHGVIPRRRRPPAHEPAVGEIARIALALGHVLQHRLHLLRVQRLVQPAQHALALSHPRVVDERNHGRDDGRARAGAAKHRRLPRLPHHEAARHGRNVRHRAEAGVVVAVQSPVELLHVALDCRILPRLAGEVLREAAAAELCADGGVLYVGYAADARHPRASRRENGHGHVSVGAVVGAAVGVAGALGTSIAGGYQDSRSARGEQAKESTRALGV
ncbi:hypothetical protein AK830_g8290 [Neonectria ditissima]|uniref:Uncharacterized protein n=1 Tax=Neonectria ditissima TaxID=78410 RepID=A0A0P7BEK8_9HYPO|nr:hypothetical protein AK830_g8290 [Neonectria ditissima]